MFITTWIEPSTTRIVPAPTSILRTLPPRLPPRLAMIDLPAARLAAAACLSLAGGASTMAAWAARRAASDEIRFAAGIGNDGRPGIAQRRFGGGDALGRRDGPRPRTAPGSSGWSGGRSGSIGRRSAAGAGLPSRPGCGGRGAAAGSRRGRNGRSAARAAAGATGGGAAAHRSGGAAAADRAVPAQPAQLGAGPARGLLGNIAARARGAFAEADSRWSPAGRPHGRACRARLRANPACAGRRA